MKERPILFNDEMVRAILEGRKTQTRRIVKHKYPQLWGGGYYATGKVLIDLENQPGAFMEFRHETQDEAGYQGSPASALVPCPHGQPGDRLWAREAHAFVPQTAYRCSTGIYQQINPADDYEACVYRENFDRSRSFPWRPSIHMPRWASRITLEITDVRVERLQGINEADAKAEGVECLGPNENVWTLSNGDKRHWRERGYTSDAQCLFADLWVSINGPGSWQANPWVWVIDFRRVDS